MNSLMGNKLLLFGIGGLILVVAAVAFMTTRPSGTTPGVNNTNTNNAVQTGSESSSDTYNTCVSACEQTQPNQERLEICKQSCEKAKNFQSDDTSDCNNLSGSLKDACFSNKAIDQANPELCGQITSSTVQAGCYTSVAKKLNDPSICDNISQSVLKTSCTEDF